MISYHFAGKDDLIREVVIEIVEAGRSYMIPRIFAETTGRATLRTYIESNLDFMREHRNYMVAVIEIAQNGGLTIDGRQRVDGREVGVAVRLLEELLARLQSEGELRADFDSEVIAVAIRAAIDAVPHRLARDPDLDLDKYARNLLPPSTSRRASRRDMTLDHLMQRVAVDTRGVSPPTHTPTSFPARLPLCVEASRVVAVTALTWSFGICSPWGSLEGRGFPFSEVPSRAADSRGIVSRDAVIEKQRVSERVRRRPDQRARRTSNPKVCRGGACFSGLGVVAQNIE